MQAPLHEKLECLYPKAQGVKRKNPKKVWTLQIPTHQPPSLLGDKNEPGPPHSHFRDLKSSLTLIPEINAELQGKKRTNIVVY